ncbi:MAG: type II toxin-antitoxin system VapC family toxin [Acidimicrobiia bacterium]
MLLLDSHVLLWVLTGRRSLGPAAAKAIQAAAAVYVSAATVWELTIKAMLGKVRLPDRFADQLEEQGLASLDVTAQHAAGIQAFPELALHDPFDRLLLAQARIEGLRLLTADRVLLALDRPFIVDARA